MIKQVPKTRQAVFHTSKSEGPKTSTGSNEPSGLNREPSILMFLWVRVWYGPDGKIYVQNHAGTVHVIEAASGKVLHRAAMGEDGDDQTRASITVAHGRLFIRTNSRLFCVGKS